MEGPSGFPSPAATEAQIQRIGESAAQCPIGTGPPSAGTPARFQILMLLWAARGRDVPHKEIVAALGVTRATVSGLMAALERDSL
jgi:DNA-binding MarR family transcriptional regulator